MRRRFVYRLDTYENLLQAVPFILRSLHGRGHRDHAQRGAAHRRALNRTDQNISSLLR